MVKREETYRICRIAQQINLSFHCWFSLMLDPTSHLLSNHLDMVFPPLAFLLNFSLSSSSSIFQIQIPKNLVHKHRKQKYAQLC